MTARDSSIETPPTLQDNAAIDTTPEDPQRGEDEIVKRLRDERDAKRPRR